MTIQHVRLCARHEIKCARSVMSCLIISRAQSSYARSCHAMPCRNFIAVNSILFVLAPLSLNNTIVILAIIHSWITIKIAIILYYA